MTTLNLANIKGTSMARDAVLQKSILRFLQHLKCIFLKSHEPLNFKEAKMSDNREKAMILFAFQLLLDKGYMDSASSLAAECSLNLEQYSICENIDLRSIFIDFESYFHLRFQKHPQYFKKLGANNGNSGSIGESLLSRMKTGQGGRGKMSSKPPQNSKIGGSSNRSSPELEETTEFCNGTSLGQITTGCNGGGGGGGDERLIKPISGIYFTSEDQRMFAESIQKEIVSRDLGTKWGDVIGLEDPKRILKETLQGSKEFAEFFGGTPPWSALLLYGPPGNGKTLVAKCVASECSTTFFNISSSTIVSKWRGDSEKIVKILFELARYHAPSTIFFDEFDAIASRRDAPGESDPSRRLKSELLQQMDGLLTNPSQAQVFILAATNLPWELDPAILRRMEKRVHVPLPNKGERLGIFKMEFGRRAQNVDERSKGRNSIQYQIDLDFLAAATEGYSGSDLHQIVKESVFSAFRGSISNNNYDKRVPKSLLIHTEDVLQIIKSNPPTISSTLAKKFTQWTSSFTN